MAHRAFALADGDGKVSSFERSTSVKEPIIFTFTGQGAQWPGMGRELIQQIQTFREDIQMMDGVLQGLESRPLWSIEGMLALCIKRPNLIMFKFRRAFEMRR